jgi:hypothetical protein
MARKLAGKKHRMEMKGCKAGKERTVYEGPKDSGCGEYRGVLVWGAEYARSTHGVHEERQC